MATRGSGRIKLTPEIARDLFAGKRMSACEIAAQFKITRVGAEAQLRKAGLAGVTWCPIHRYCEDLSAS